MPWCLQGPGVWLPLSFVIYHNSCRMVFFKAQDILKWRTPSVKGFHFDFSKTTNKTTHIYIYINQKIALFSPSLHSTPGSLTGRTGNMVEWGWMVGKRGCDVVKLETLFKKSYKSWHAEYRNIPFITQFHTSQADRAKGISSNRQYSPTLKWWSLAKKNHGMRSYRRL